MEGVVPACVQMPAYLQQNCLFLFTQLIQHTPSVDFPWGGNASVFRLNFEPRGLHAHGARGGAAFGCLPGEARLPRLPNFSFIARRYLILSFELRESMQPSGAHVHIFVHGTNMSRVYNSVPRYNNRFYSTLIYKRSLHLGSEWYTLRVPGYTGMYTPQKCPLVITPTKSESSTI